MSIPCPRSCCPAAASLFSSRLLMLNILSHALADALQRYPWLQLPTHGDAATDALALCQDLLALRPASPPRPCPCAPERGAGRQAVPGPCKEVVCP